MAPLSLPLWSFYETPFPCQQTQIGSRFPWQHDAHQFPESGWRRDARWLAPVVPCYAPQAAWRDPSSGSVVFVGPGRLSNLTLPCGQCIGCRLERSRQWAVRCLHESRLHPYSSFLTLTYAPENVPDHGSLSVRDHQLFMKRVRKMHNVRFYSCGEYGPTTGRPHYHVCLFGYHFPDRQHFGDGFFTSAELSALWPLGHASVGNLTFESAAYTARYVCEKITGDAAKKHYERIDPDTGEIVSIQPEFNLMSRRPGIGRAFFDAYHDEMYPHDYAVVRGKKSKPPRYYDKLFEKIDSDAMEAVRIQRELDAHVRHLDNTPSRLRVREKVTRAQLAKRSGEF